MGVPTVGGEAVFDEAYRDNCLVNAMCVGLLPVERVMRAKATGSGQVIVLYGATTGRDGIGGASVLASQELDGSHDKRPSVEIGDPFTGKKLIEASVELVQAGWSSRCRTAARRGSRRPSRRWPPTTASTSTWSGFRSARRDGAVEVMISESQERMVAIGDRRGRGGRGGARPLGARPPVIGEVTVAASCERSGRTSWSARFRRAS